MFYIEIKGKKYNYNSIESAVSAANEIAAKTGIIVGIFHY